MVEKDLTKKVLVETAKDLSTIFEQPIKTGGKTTNDEIKKDLISAGNELQKDDKIADKSKEVLTLLGVKLSFEKEKEVPNEKAEKEEKASGASVTKKARAKGPSNKSLVYQKWDKSGRKETPEKLYTLIKQSVKLSTIKSWIQAWKNGKNLPAMTK